jgi:serine protease AprX
MLAYNRSETKVKKLAVFFLWGALVYGAGPKMDKVSKDLKNVDPSLKVDVIVQWKHQVGQEQDDKVANWGGKTKHKFSSIKGGRYSLPASAIGGLANDPDVAFISPDRPLKAKTDYAVAAVNAKVAWQRGLDGSGISVAVIDSGLNPNDDMSKYASVLYSEDFTGEFQQKSNIADPGNAPDRFGHGQHVAGIIASTGKSSTCAHCTRLFRGIAPGVSIVNLRALDENGAGTDSTVISAIDRAIALKDTYKIRIINLSLGRPVYESYKQDPLCQAVERAWKAGIVVVVAAGNDGRDNSMGTDGYGTINAPGNDPYVITVGAMKPMDTYDRTDDRIASYSSKGPSLIDNVVKPDIMAPGNQIISLLAKPDVTLAKQNPGNLVALSYYQSDKHGPATSPAYFNLSGTSMATPVVSGAVADMLQAQPTLTPDQVKARLMLTAYKTFPASSTATDTITGESFVSYYDMFTVGAGYLDLGAALSDNTVATGTAISPSITFDRTSGVAALTADPSSVWYVNPAYSPDNVWIANAFLQGGSASSTTVDATRTVLRQLNTVDATRTVLRQLDTVNAERTVLRQLDTVDAERTVLRQLDITITGEN